MAENLLKKRFRYKYEFFSAGISPISMANMDPRSQGFLKDNDVEHSLHVPKKINRKMLNYFDKFLAVDPYVLNQMNINYPKYKHKFCLLTAQFKDINIIDQYRFPDDEYLKIMSDIKHVVQEIDLEEI